MDSVLETPHSEPSRIRRPLGITVVAFVMIIAGVAFVCVGGSIFIAGTHRIAGMAGASAAIGGLAAAGGVIFLLFGLLHIIVAIGLSQMREAARILAVLLFSLSFVGAAIAGAITLVRLNLFALGWDLLVLMGDILLIRYLFDSQVKLSFAGRPFRSDRAGHLK